MEKRKRPSDLELENPRGKYRIIERKIDLGDGEWITVYKKHYTHPFKLKWLTNKYSFVKLLKDDFDNRVEKIMRNEDKKLFIAKSGDSFDEIEVLMKLGLNTHPNIVSVEECYMQNLTDIKKRHCYYIMERAIWDLRKPFKHIHNSKKSYKENMIKFITKSIASGLAHMHKHGFIHGDLKPENVIHTDNGFKIIDFGLTRKIEDNLPAHGTPFYMAPEGLIDPYHTNEKVDIWALGVIFAELCSPYSLLNLPNSNPQIEFIDNYIGRIPQLNVIFPKANMDDAIKRDQLLEYSHILHKTQQREKLGKTEPVNPLIHKQIIDAVGQKGYNLWIGMTELNPNDRFSAEEILETPYLK